jgi:hypothetical protein
MLGLWQPRLRRFDEQRKRPSMCATAGKSVANGTSRDGITKCGPDTVENAGHSEHRAMLHTDG